MPASPTPDPASLDSASPTPDSASPDSASPDPASPTAAGTSATRRDAAVASDDRLRARNEVLLVGRVSGTPEQRELPSGDSIVSWRIVVDRIQQRPRREGMRGASVDTFDCVAWTPGLRRTARGLADGDVIELEAALRRRFWRAGAGAASRCELEVSRVRRLRRQASR